ncbi:MAG TPA: hypothetical protein P5042_05610, partial [Candidatus Izemoplasmatales bacterium]|nr:hypothetical protein [Candidatus Izemoplasmatales bacterium]
MKKWLKRNISSEFTLAIAEILHRTRKIITIIILLGFLASLLPQNTKVYADADTISTDELISSEEEAETCDTTTDENFDMSSVALVGEVESLRTANTKIFEREDGTYVAAIYNDVVHYIDSDGIYQNIDNSLNYESESDSYQNKANSFSIQFPKSLTGNKKITLSMDEYSIDWSVLAIKETNVTYENTEKKPESIKELVNVE